MMMWRSEIKSLRLGHRVRKRVGQLSGEAGRDKNMKSSLSYVQKFGLYSKEIKNDF